MLSPPVFMKWTCNNCLWNNNGMVNHWDAFHKTCHQIFSSFFSKFLLFTFFLIFWQSRYLFYSIMKILPTSFSTECSTQIEHPNLWMGSTEVIMRSVLSGTDDVHMCHLWDRKSEISASIFCSRNYSRVCYRHWIWSRYIFLLNILSHHPI